MDFAEERNAEWLRLSPGIRTDDGQIDSIESVLLVSHDRARGSRT
jgi:hypothetical protein